MVQTKGVKMPSRRIGVRALACAALALALSGHGAAMDIVKGGVPLAHIVVKGGGEPVAYNPDAFMRRGHRVPRHDRTDPGALDNWVAHHLADWIRKITDAHLMIGGTAPAGKPAIYVGLAAREAGLELDDIDSASNEGVRIVVKGNKALIGGQNAYATGRAAGRFLEGLGCRYFMDTSYYRGNKKLGEVVRPTKNLKVQDYTLTEKPKLLYRHVWGSSWYTENWWKVWNGQGGMSMGMGHSWSSYVPAKEYFETHPEYFSLRDGKRKQGEWLCTTNQGVRDIFVKKLLAQAKAGGGKGSFSISPPDNRDYCQCRKCEARDDPRQIVPSSGKVSVSKRYMEFYDHVARRVAAKRPDVTLNFYCYADYTEPPLDKQKSAPSLVAWIAPIRYSRYHHIGNPISPSRMELKRVIDGWSEVVDRLGYRTYNFNLAESTVPFSKTSTWAHDLPYLARRGCIGINVETFAAWSIMGPAIYQCSRLAYDPYLDSDELMDDYFMKFYGPDAGPPMKEYWLGIDRAFQELKSEAGSYFALHVVYTPEFLKQLQGLLDRAARLARGNEMYSARVAFANQGLTMAWDYSAMRQQMNQGNFAEAKDTAYRMYDRAKADQFAFHNKTLEYVRRFLKYNVEVADRYTRAPNRKLEMLPDQWRMAYDPEQKGVGKGYHQPDFDDSSWRQVRTYSATLNEQGAPEQFTFMWYRSSFNVPKTHGKLLLLFLDVDGEPSLSSLYVNGKELKFEPNRSKRGKWYLQRRKPVWAYVTEAVTPGKNTVALMLDHRNISENFLGGIVRPVVLCENNEPEAAPKK